MANLSHYSPINIKKNSDLLRYITREEPETVFAMAHAHDEEIKAMDDVDTVFIQVKMPSGVLCHIELGRDSRYGYDQSIEVFGQLGKLWFEKYNINCIDKKIR